MNEYRVELSPQARDDMTEIWLYILNELCNPQAADAFLDDVEKELEKLGHMPGKLKTVDLKPWKSLGLRKVRIKNYYMYYIISDERSMVSVLAVTYSGRDQERVLSDSFTDATPDEI